MNTPSTVLLTRELAWWEKLSLIRFNYMKNLWGSSHASHLIFWKIVEFINLNGGNERIYGVNQDCIMPFNFNQHYCSFCDASLISLIFLSIILLKKFKIGITVNW